MNNVLQGQSFHELSSVTSSGTAVFITVDFMNKVTSGGRDSIYRNRYFVNNNVLQEQSFLSRIKLCHVVRNNSVRNHRFDE